MRSILISVLLAGVAASGAETYTISTLAGSDWVGDGGLATSAILVQSEGVLSDAAGNVYVADAGDHRVRRVSAKGVISTIAGTGVFGFSGDGEAATQAQLNSPYGLAMDGQGNLYIADLGNARVRRIGLDGSITTVAGGGALPAGGANEGSPATMLALSAPRNLAFDTSGNLYISDFSAARVYRMSPGGSLTTVAGTGSAGIAGDNGAATAAQLNHPAALAFDSQGALYIADSGNHLVRRIKQGLISSFARASTPTGLAFDGAGSLYVADTSAGNILVFPSTGIASAGSPSSIAVSAVDVSFSSSSGLYASTGNGVALMGAGNMIAIAGGGSLAHGDNGLAAQARLNHPSGVAMDAVGNVYIADRDNNRIRRVSPDSTIVTIAGTGAVGNLGDGGLASQAQLNQPSSVSVDASGNLYISDTGNHRVRKVTPDGKILAATNLGLISPVNAIPDGAGNLYIADAAAGKILTAGANGVPATLLSGLASPYGLALDTLGDLYFTEAGAARVSRRSASGAMATLGSGWSIPRGLTVDGSGNVYVADTALQQIVEIDSSGAVTPIAGSGSTGFSGDGGSATAAQLGFPWSIATGTNGTMIFADLANSRIRALTPPAAPPTKTQGGSPTPVAGNLTIVNAASLAPGPVTAGMLLLIGGAGISPSQIPDTVIAFGPNPARILSADPSGILVVAPVALAGLDSVPIEIIYQNNVLATIPVAVADAAPALFADSTGQAAATNQDGSLNSATAPSARGSIISFFGTGLGISNDPVSVTFNNFPAQVLYAGPVPGYPGLFQVNAVVPTGYLPTGDLLVIASVGSSSSQSGVLAWVD